MIDQDKREFAQCIRATMGFYGKEVSTEAMVIWYSTLVEFDLADIRRALTMHMRNPDTGQFAPKPADVVRQLQGPTGNRALVAWSKVEKGIQRVGNWRSVAFDDPIIHKVIEDMGGWVKLCGTPTEEELHFQGKEFEKRYQGYAMRGGVGNDFPPKLLGTADAQNILNGYEAEEPMLIGDQAKAMLVLQGGSSEPSIAIGQAGKSVRQLLSDSIPKLTGDNSPVQG